MHYIAIYIGKKVHFCHLSRKLTKLLNVTWDISINFPGEQAKGTRAIRHQIECFLAKSLLWYAVPRVGCGD